VKGHAVLGSMRFAPDVDAWSSDAVNVAGPIATIIAMIAFIYWGLAREWLVTGASHRREVTRLETTQARELAAREAALTAERVEHAAEVSQIRADYERQITRREGELQATITTQRGDLSRMFAAWQITEDALSRVTDSRLTAGGEMMSTMLEALRASPLGDRLPSPPPQLPGSEASESG